MQKQDILKQLELRNNHLFKTKMKEMYNQLDLMEVNEIHEKLNFVNQKYFEKSNVR